MQILDSIIIATTILHPNEGAEIKLWDLSKLLMNVEQEVDLMIER